MAKQLRSAQPSGALRDNIYKAARQLFVENGYHTTSIPDIVGTAGVSVGAFYHYFASKEHLAKQIHTDAVHEFLRRFEEQVLTQSATKERIRAYTALMFTWAEEDPEMVEYLLYARPREVLNKYVSICSEEGLTAVKIIIKDGLDRGDIRPMDVFIGAATLSGILIRMIELRLDGNIPYPLTDVVDQVVENIWLSLGKF